MITHTKTQRQAGRFWLRFSAIALAGIISWSTPLEALAISSWNPTLYVNTESFQEIDAGDGTTDKELRFGGSSNFIKFLTSSRFRFSHGISVLGTISGSSLNVDRNATVGGALTVTGAITTKGTVSGTSLVVSGASSYSGTALFRTSATVKGTLSGQLLRVSAGGADIQGALNASGAIRTDSDLTLNADDAAADVTLTFMNSGTDETLAWKDTLNKFQFSNALSVLGTISGSALNVDRNATVGGTFTATGYSIFKNGLSGANLVVSGASSFSGSILARTNITAKGALSGSQLFSAGLGDCNSDVDDKLLYDPAIGKFRCGPDQGGAGGGISFAFAEGVYVNQKGDTMTGALTIDLTSGFIGLKVIETASGNIIHAEKNLSSSGSLTWEGAGSGNSLFVQAVASFSGAVRLETSLTGATINGFGLTSCSTSGSKLLYNASTSKFFCGTDRASYVRVKTQTETLQNSATLQADNELGFNIGANETWSFFANLIASGSTTADWKFAISAPSGSKCAWAIGEPEIATASGISLCYISSSTTSAAAKAATARLEGSSVAGNNVIRYSEPIYLFGTIFNNGTTGSGMRLYWAQGQAVSTGRSAIYSGSYLVAFKSQGGADLAEIYYSRQFDVRAGDVVSIDPSAQLMIRRSTTPYDPMAIGIVSTQPGMLIGDRPTTPQTILAKPVPVALSGRVPVKVTLDSGPILPGDFLTTSNKSGYAMKATKPGPVLCQALSGFSGPGNDGMVLCFIKAFHRSDDAQLRTTIDSLEQRIRQLELKLQGLSAYGPNPASSAQTAGIDGKKNLAIIVDPRKQKAAPPKTPAVAKKK